MTESTTPLQKPPAGRRPQFPLRPPNQKSQAGVFACRREYLLPWRHAAAQVARAGGQPGSLRYRERLSQIPGGKCCVSRTGTATDSRLGPDAQPSKIPLTATRIGLPGLRLSWSRPRCPDLGAVARHHLRGLIPVDRYQPSG